jgi:hypothetical protein
MADGYGEVPTVFYELRLTEWLMVMEKYQLYFTK